MGSVPSIRIGALILAVTDESQSTKSWATGAAASRKSVPISMGSRRQGSSRCTTGGDPAPRPNIDHVAITPSGVWVIDPKRYQGEARRRDVGGWFSTDVRLYVGRRDCTNLVEAVDKQVGAVRKALGTEWDEIPVRPMLCFQSEWPLFSKPFDFEGVLVTWPKAMRQLLVRPGPYDRATVQLIADKLDERLRPAS